MIDWRIYYGDGSTYCNEDGPDESAPTCNVICVACYDDDNRRRLIQSFDFYWRDDGRWCGSDQFGLWDYLSRPGWKAVKFGRMIGDHQYRSVMSQAIHDLPIARAA